MGGFAPHFSEPRACEGGKSLKLTPKLPAFCSFSGVEFRWDPAAELGTSWGGCPGQRVLGIGGCELSSPDYARGPDSSGLGTRKNAVAL